MTAPLLETTTLIGQSFLCHSVVWDERQPFLKLQNTAGDLFKLKIIDQNFGFKNTSPQHKYCLGYSKVTDGQTNWRYCLNGNVASTGKQCKTCTQADEFKFIHFAHTTGFISSGLKSYLAQEHWVYLATFADGSSKVGTAAMRHKNSRLDEQGAIRATHIAHCPDGITARILEDEITTKFGIAQSKRAASKHQWLTKSLGFEEITLAHKKVVEYVLAQDFSTARVNLINSDWAPPRGQQLFFSHQIVGYPVAINSGAHRFTPLAGIGQNFLIDLAGGDNCRAVVDFSQLQGRKIEFGSFTKPKFDYQTSLF